jgi:oxygen-independent coproporphyrinogen-3 oxidase
LAGIYIHVPFCKQACYYCDFHFSTSLKTKQQVVDALCREIELQKDYLGNRDINTLYFGGGTPSILDERDLAQIFETISRYHTLKPDAEITLEANPDDLDKPKLEILREFGINRLSIGIQTFDDKQLQFLHRAHNAYEAANCVKLAQDVGIDNISIDLIYGIPSPDHDIWQSDLQKATELGTKHISAYCLTIEPQTVFGKWQKKGQLKPADEEYAAVQFEMLLAHLQANGFEQYEISNFALPGFYSRHNSNYWKDQPYLGLGPSAHSYNLESRQYNVANNTKYAQALQQNKLDCTVEKLSSEDRINEYIMTSLRTSWGCDTSKISRNYKVDILAIYADTMQKLQQEQMLNIEDGIIRLTTRGKLVADRIASDLFF